MCVYDLEIVSATTATTQSVCVNVCTYIRRIFVCMCVYNLQIVPLTTATAQCVREKCVHISAKCMHLCVYMISRLCRLTATNE